MTSDAHSARENLAFMRSVVEDDGRGQLVFGAIYLAAGLLYAGQLAVNWAEWAGALTLSTGQSVAFIVAINILVAAVIVVALLRFRGGRSGLAARGVNAAFAGVAATALTLAGVFAIISAHQHSMAPWLIYGPVTFALQGGGWLSSFLLRRRGWHGLVAVGWLGAALLMGWWMDSALYALVAAAAFLLCMALPGLALVRQAQRQA